MASGDPVVHEFREQISAADRAILEAVNTRLGLVARLKEYKDAHGIGFVDPDREAALLRELERANDGPLSSEGLRELFTQILELTKRELSR